MYAIEEIGDEECGFSWNILQIEGQEATTVASCFAQPFAKKILTALQWQESMKDARMSLGLDRVAVKPKAKPRAKPVSIQFTKAKK